MSQLIRLVYASQSNSPARAGSTDPVVGNILAQSRRNNDRDNIGGILYYGNGFFFQCLEGDRSKVEQAYERIRSDVRHRAPRILRLQTVNRRLFGDWSMKYVPSDDDVRAFLELKGIDEFRPYDFAEPLIDELVLYFQHFQLPISAAVGSNPANRSFKADLAAAAVDAKKAGLWDRIADALGLRKSA